MVNLLLDNENCNVDILSNSGYTALHYAALNNDLITVKKLLKKKAKFCMSRRGYTPYHAAVNQEATEVIKFFLDTVKIDVNLKTAEGKNALQIAVNHQDLGIINILLDHEIDVNHPINNDQGTPLFTAVLANNYELFDLLVKRGADIRENLLKVSASRRRDHFEITRQLLLYGADIDKLDMELFFSPTQSAKLLRHHALKLKAVNLFAQGVIAEVADAEFYRKCTEEVGRMK